MKLKFCSREEEAAAALLDEGWSDANDSELRAHIDECPHCMDVVLVAQALRQARIETARAATLPASGVLWWRAQIRRRSGAFERATRPIAVVEKLALVAVALGFACLAAWQWNQISDWVLQLTYLARPNTSLLDTLWTPFSGVGGWILASLIVSLGALALFGGLAIYLLVEKE